MKKIILSAIVFGTILMSCQTTLKKEEVKPTTVDSVKVESDTMSADTLKH